MLKKPIEKLASQSVKEAHYRASDIKPMKRRSPYSHSEPINIRSPYRKSEPKQESNPL